MRISSCHLLGLVVLAEARCRALSQLLELGRSVVETSQVARERCFRIRTDWSTTVDAIEATNLLFVSLEHFLGVQHLESVFEQVNLAFIVAWSVRSH